MCANGFMNAKTATHYFAQRQEIAAYSAHMDQLPAPQFKFRVNQEALAVCTPNPSIKRDALKRAHYVKR